MLNFLKTLALPLVLSAFALSTSASAQEWGVRFGKNTKRGHVSIGVGSRGIDVHAQSRYGQSRYGQVHHGHSQRGHSSHGKSRHVHSSSCWSGGHYRTVHEQVWVPGCTRQVWVPARYDYYTDAYGCTQRRLIHAGHYDYVQDPGYFEHRDRQVWVPRTYNCGHGHSNITRRW